MKTPTIYVAGHTGLVGSAIVRALEAGGYDRILMRTLDELDLTDQAQTRDFLAREHPDVVILAAARVGGILANWEYPYEFVQENLAMEVNVIHEAFRAGAKRLMFLGSSCIYPRLAPQPLKEEYLLTGPLEETNRPYAIAKIAGIEMCRSLAREYGTECVSLMPTNLYGPGDNFNLETSHLLPALIRKFHEGKGRMAADGGGAAAGAGAAADGSAPVTLWGTGTPRRELLYVDDLAAAIRLLLELPDWHGIPDGMLNIGTGQDLTIAELATIVAGVVGYDGPVVWDTEKPDGTPQKLLDTSRINSLGWAPATDLETGIRKSYEWFLGKDRT
jgi:GDP-L-fucose synthase